MWENELIYFKNWNSSLETIDHNIITGKEIRIRYQ